MPWNGSVCRYGGYLIELPEPADQAAVDDRDAVDKQQIGEPERSRLFIEYRQIVVGMCWTVSPHHQTPSSQIEIEPGGNEDGWRYHLAAFRLTAESLANSPQVIVAALCEGARQFDMADKIGVVVAESCGTEDVVGMDVGQDHILDWPIGERPDRGAQLATLPSAAARIDHRHGVVSDNEADIGNCVIIRRSGLLMHPVVDKDPRGDFADRQPSSFAAIERRPKKDEYYSGGKRRPEDAHWDRSKSGRGGAELEIWR